MGRVIITIDEIIAGRGLHSNRRTIPPSLEVFCGCGLKFGENNDLCVHAGPGLTTNADNEITIANEEVAGIGLVPGPGSQIDINTEVATDQQQSFRVLTSAKFQMDGYSLVFVTTYTIYNVIRNDAGVVLGIEEGESITEMQPLNIDGYSNTTNVTTVKSTSGQPSFYKK